MKRLLNTLYVTSGNRYLSLDGENVVVLEEQKEIGRVPLHNLQAIVTFGYTGASPALMGTCAQRNIDLTFMSGNGRFLARITGETKGNVTLRKQQYRISEDKEKSTESAKIPMRVSAMPEISSPEKYIIPDGFWKELREIMHYGWRLKRSKGNQLFLHRAL